MSADLLDKVKVINQEVETDNSNSTGKEDSMMKKVRSCMLEVNNILEEAEEIEKVQMMNKSLTDPNYLRDKTQRTMPNHVSYCQRSSVLKR